MVVVLVLLVMVTMELLQYCKRYGYQFQPRLLTGQPECVEQLLFSRSSFLNPLLLQWHQTLFLERLSIDSQVPSLGHTLSCLIVTGGAGWMWQLQVPEHTHHVPCHCRQKKVVF